MPDTAPWEKYQSAAPPWEKYAAATEKPKAQPPQTFMERLAEGFRGPEKVKQEVSEADLASAPRFAVPGGSSTPLAEGISEAQSVASLGATSEIGTPRSAAATTAAGKVLKSATEVPKATKESIGRFVRKQGVVGVNPKGKLKPGTSAAARLAGGAAGGLAGSVAGHPGTAVGAMIGEHAGYGLAESFLPAHPDPRLPTVNEAIKAQLAERYPQIGAYRNAVAARAKAAAPPSTSPTTAPATLYPEPRVAGPTERPGAMYSVPREQLPGLAASGTPGAADVLRATGNAVLFEPKSGVGYPGPRTVENVSQGTVQQVQAAPQPARAAVLPEMPRGSAIQVSKATPALPESRSTQITEQTPGVETIAQFLKKKRQMAEAATRIDRATEEARRLGIGDLSSLEKRYIADVMDQAEYAKLNDVAKKQLLRRRALGGK